MRRRYSRLSSAGSIPCPPQSQAEATSAPAEIRTASGTGLSKARQPGRTGRPKPEIVPVKTWAPHSLTDLLTGSSVPGIKVHSGKSHT